MKKTLSVLLVLFMFVFAFTSCAALPDTTGDITGYAQNHTIIGRTVSSFSVNADGDFTVLQFSDTHFISGNTKKDLKTLDAIKAQINAVSPDLVVISGDMVEGNNKNEKYNKRTALETVGTLFEDLHQYWAYVPGNNDGEKEGSSADVAAFLAQYPKCIVANQENLTGATQYAVDIQDAEGVLLHSLIFMDSLARDDENHYDYMKADQVQWAEDVLAEKKSENPQVKCSFFFHMNTPNFLNSGKNGTPYSADYSPIPKDFYEGINGNAAFDKAMENAECVGLVSIGHIHPKTNYCSYLNGTYYHVVRAAGYRVAKNPGCVQITIHTTAEDTKDMYTFEEIVF